MAAVHGVEPVEHLGAHRVIKALELSLDMRDASGELWMLPKPLLTEGCLALQVRDAVFCCDNPAIEPVRHGLCMPRPSLLCMRLG